jgi:hypothetical protein
MRTTGFRCNSKRMRCARISSLSKLGVVILVFLGQSFGALHSATNSQLDADQLARDVFNNEIAAAIHDQSLWCYDKLREEAGREKLFEVCQTKDGEIERLLKINGQELSPQQRQAEDQRIRSLLNHPDQMRQAQKKQQEDSKQTQDLMRMFPEAFRFQYEGLEGNLVKLKFFPKPDFHPSGRPAQVLRHLEGHLLVDTKQKRLAEIDGKLTSEVKFGWGLLGHLDKGGTFFVKQEDVGSGHWQLTAMDVEMNGKALFFKTISVREKETYADFRQVPDGISAAQAFELLREASARRCC